MTRLGREEPLRATILNFNEARPHIGAILGLETDRTPEAEASGGGEPPEHLEPASEEASDAGRLPTPGQARGEDGCGSFSPVQGNQDEDSQSALQNSGADQRFTVPRGDVGSGSGNPPEQRLSSLAPAPADDEVDHRWLANYRRSEVIALNARVEELERRLRLRTFALAGTLTLGGLGAIGTAYLAVKPLLKPPPAVATHVAATSGSHAEPARAAAPAPKEQISKPTAGLTPTSAHLAPPVVVSEAVPPTHSGSVLPGADEVSGPLSRTDPPHMDGVHTTITASAPVQRTALEWIAAKEPQAEVKNEAARSDPDQEPRPLGTMQPTEVATATSASSTAPPGLETRRYGQQTNIGHSDGIGAGMPRALPASTLDDGSGNGRTEMSPARRPYEPHHGKGRAGRDGPASDRRNAGEKGSIAEPSGIDAESAPAEPSQARGSGEVPRREPYQVSLASAVVAAGPSTTVAEPEDAVHQPKGIRQEKLSGPPLPSSTTPAPGRTERSTQRITLPRATGIEVGALRAVLAATKRSSEKPRSTTGGEDKSALPD